MFICPVCGKFNKSPLCSCGYDDSRSYEKYPTLSLISKGDMQQGGGIKAVTENLIAARQRLSLMRDEVRNLSELDEYIYQLDRIINALPELGKKRENAFISMEKAQSHIYTRASAGFGHMVYINSGGKPVFSGNVGLSYRDPDPGTAVAVASGNDFCLILNSEKRVSCVGNLKNNEILKTWENVTAIAAGADIALGLREDGRVYACGPGTAGIEAWRDIAMLDAGNGLVLGLRKDGRVLSAGTNAAQCSRTDSWRDIVMLAAGSNHVLGLRSDGRVVCSGANTMGQCMTDDWKNIVAIAAGSLHSLGLCEDGQVLAVGYNFDNPCNVKNWKNIKSIAAGSYMSFGLREDGELLMTGKTY